MKTWSSIPRYGFKKLLSENTNEKINKDGYVYCKIKLGMYGLKQAALLAYQQLK